jgi:DNA-directed RNA polymerase specialized sigma24 family protein
VPSRNKNKELIQDIKNGNEEILIHLFKKHYIELKAIFSSYTRDEKVLTAEIARVIVRIWLEIHRNDFSENIDLESYLLNTAKDSAEKLAADKRLKNIKSDRTKTPQEIIADCVNALGDSSRKALELRYAEHYSIEEVAEKLKIDVAAAHDLLDKSFMQLSSIAKIRMEFTT